MKRALSSLALLGLAASLAPACSSGFGTIGQGKKLVVTLKADDYRGSLGSPLPVSVVSPVTFHVKVEAQLPDGTLDTSFNGSINLSVQPGTISDLTVRNIELKAGVNVPIAGDPYIIVPVIGAFGQAHIWAEDLGFEPEAPNSNPPPQCADGIDNNNNGLIDYPADPGCYAPVDNTEDLGSYAAGVSDALYFAEPRIELVRGYDPKNNGNGNAAGFPHQQISIDTGWRGGQDYAFSTVVIGLTSAGFYVQDLQSDEHPGGGCGGSGPGGAPGTGSCYGGLYAYNFSTPAFMRVCDRVQILSGTSSDFYGYTELNYPTWQIEYWNPMTRPCLVPEATMLGTADLNQNNRLWQTEATLVRVGVNPQNGHKTTAHVASHFGPGDVPVDNAHCLTGQTAPCYIPDATHTNCDFDHTGKINYNDPLEAACAKACAGSCTAAPYDYECSEFSSFESQNDFELIVDDATDGSHARIQVNAAAANGFNPLDYRGQTIPAFTGLLAYFSGGCQFTINARCSDDIVSDPHGSPLASDVACVHPRTLSDINANSQ